MKIYVATRRYLLFACGVVFLLCGVVMFGASHVGDVVSAAAPRRDLPIYSVGIEEKKASLSFDAAWAA